MHLVAQPPLGPDAHAIADDEHPDHQLRIDRGATRVTIKGLQLLANARQVDEPVDRAQQMIRRHVPLQAEAVKQRLLRHRPLAPHRPVSAYLAEIESDHQHHCKTAFSTQSGQAGFEAGSFLPGFTPLSGIDLCEGSTAALVPESIPLREPPAMPSSAINPSINGPPTRYRIAAETAASAKLT
ncbi:hypothetical protein WR25_24559 [Diploscapter pachys]|uniref:Uncharacterized protein n=1 Tax=Diploscapter pachys TaxID=2018661 RepID=A0A2A2KG28_9BILA|nr:hypothetical protein WR25_24559 [Diploscapter pachys]